MDPLLLLIPEKHLGFRMETDVCKYKPGLIQPVSVELECSIEIKR